MNEDEDEGTLAATLQPGIAVGRGDGLAAETDVGLN